MSVGGKQARFNLSSRQQALASGPGLIEMAGVQKVEARSVRRCRPVDKKEKIRGTITSLTFLEENLSSWIRRRRRTPDSSRNGESTLYLLALLTCF